MTKQEFLAASLPYGLYVSDFDETPRKIIGIHGDYCHVDYNEIGYEEMFLNDAEPIIRHPSDITKSIVQANYNNGESFIPIIELAKMGRQNSNGWIIKHDFCEFNFGPFTDSFMFDGENFSITSYPNYDPPHFITESRIAVRNQLKLFQQLIKWHFWPNMSKEEEVIYITNNFNPYI